MYNLIFESLEEAEHFRQYLKEYAGIDLSKARERTDDSLTHYEFENYGYPGFVMTMVHRICYTDGIDYAKMVSLPQTQKEKYLLDQLFSHAMVDMKAWRPPSSRSREFNWVTENLGLSERSIRKVLQRAEKKYYHWLKMDSYYSLLIGFALLIMGVFVAFFVGLTHWATILLFSFAVILLLFGIVKTFQYNKKNRSRLPR